jgi:hypothetical protein
LVEFQIADQVTERGGREVFMAFKGRSTRSVSSWIGHLEVNDGVDLHGDVILGDDRLRREVVNRSLREIGTGPVDDRDDEVEPASSVRLYLPKRWTMTVLLRDDDDRADDDDQQDEQENAQNTNR